MKRRHVRIRSMGKYLPKRVVTSEELDLKLNLKPGTLEGLAGVKTRRYAGEGESLSRMGALAGMAALENGHLKYEDIDVIINASGCFEQPIPCTAAFIQRELGKENSGTPCFDINSTCLGYVVGLDVASALIESGRYNRVLLVSSEMASIGLPWKQLEACALFGDGAVASVIERTPEGESSSIIGAHHETYSSGAEFCEIKGGGAKLHARNYRVGGLEDERYLFNMEGRKVFKQASQYINAFVSKLETSTNLKLKDYKMVVPHQASGSGMELMRKKLEVQPESWMNIIADYGNMIAASIPLALSLAIDDGRIKRGDNVLLIGTSAGFSIGGLAFQY